MTDDDSTPAGGHLAPLGDPADRDQTGDFADEHARTWLDEADGGPGSDADGESESPAGHSGLEPDSGVN